MQAIRANGAVINTCAMAVISAGKFFQKTHCATFNLLSPSGLFIFASFFCRTISRWIRRILSESNRLLFHSVIIILYIHNSIP